MREAWPRVAHWQSSDATSKKIAADCWRINCCRRAAAKREMRFLLKLKVCRKSTWTTSRAPIKGRASMRWRAWFSRQESWIFATVFIAACAHAACASSLFDAESVVCASKRRRAGTDIARKLNAAGVAHEWVRNARAMLQRASREQRAQAGGYSRLRVDLSIFPAGLRGRLSWRTCTCSGTL
ncbi:hypothetical protein RCH06_003151 [Polaromonas sp. CG_9.5]|nr:hypothetical protein [Polaromonas sp. CG_9.5]